jgi:hypothetical protein
MIEISKDLYQFSAHIESDECGGLPGFGYTGEIQSKKHGDVLTGNGFSFKFIDYPSEVHLQNGVVFYEETREIFFSSKVDLRSAKDPRGSLTNC